MSDRDAPPAGVDGCCAAFWKAWTSGTDNEGWGKLFSVDDREKPAAVLVGDGMPPVKFCPWCGTPVQFVEPK